MFRERSDELRFLVSFFDLVLAFVAFALSYSLRFAVLDPSLQELQLIRTAPYWVFGLLLSVSQVLSFSLLGLYKTRKFLSFVGEVGILTLGTFLNIIFSFAMLYVLHLYSVSRLIPILFALTVVMLTVIGHSLFRVVLRRLRSQGRGVHPMIVIGVTETARKAAKALQGNQLYGYRVAGFVAESLVSEVQVPASEVLGTLDELESIVEKHQPRDVFFAVDHGNQESLAEALRVCDREGIQMHIVPGFGNLITASGVLENLNGLPLISIRDIPAREGVNRILKRAFDVVFSGAFILIFSPLYLVLAIAVKLSGRGPVFFTQERVGLDNNVFRIIKFRTMKVQEEVASDSVWTTKGDPRITKVGRFLRQTSLDEIPQFFNIFLGQMSVVGPRPERPYYVEQFKDTYTYFKRRHAVKAGLTGWAQINGLRGDTSIRDRIDADLFYIENWTFLLDLKIVMLTPFKGMIHKNAY